MSLVPLRPDLRIAEGCSRAFVRTRRQPTPAQVWHDFSRGMHYRHPWCCVLRFSLSTYKFQGMRRGGKWTERAGVFVPCHWFHWPDDDEMMQPEPYL